MSSNESVIDISLESSESRTTKKKVDQSEIINVEEALSKYYDDVYKYDIQIPLNPVKSISVIPLKNRFSGYHFVTLVPTVGKYSHGVIVHYQKKGDKIKDDSMTSLKKSEVSIWDPNGLEDSVRGIPPEYGNLIIREGKKDFKPSYNLSPSRSWNTTYGYESAFCAIWCIIYIILKHEFSDSNYDLFKQYMDINLSNKEKMTSPRKGKKWIVRIYDKYFHNKNPSKNIEKFIKNIIKEINYIINDKIELKYQELKPKEKRARKPNKKYDS